MVKRWWWSWVVGPVVVERVEVLLGGGGVGQRIGWLNKLQRQQPGLHEDLQWRDGSIVLMMIQAANPYMQTQSN